MASTAAVLNILVNANTGAAVGQLTALDGKLKQTATSAQGASVAMGPKLAKAAKVGAVGLAVGLGAALVSASKKSRQFERQMSNLGAVTDANERQMKRLEKQALKLGAATQFSATEAAAAQVELAKGGLAVEQILGGGLQAALALAAAGEMELAQAGETVVNTMGLFSLHGKDAMRIADMLATAANKTTVDVDDLAMSLKMGGAVAKQAGYDLNNTVQVLEALAESGVKNSDAGTSMKAAMIQLLNPTAKQAKLAKQLGIEWINQNGSMKSAIQISKALQSATGDMTKAERTKAFAVLAGTDGFRTLAALYDAGPRKLREYEKANAKQGEAARVAAKKMDNLEGDLEELSGAWETLQLMVGGPVNDAMREVVQALTSVLQVVGKFNLDRATTQLKVLETKSEDVADAVRIATDAWKVLGPAVRMAAQLIAATVKAIIGVVRGMAQMFRGVIRIVAGLLRGDWGRAWEGAKDIASGGVKVISATLGRLKDSMRIVLDGIRDIMRNIFGDAWDRVENIFTAGANAVIGVVNAVIDVINKIPGVPDIGPVGAIGSTGVQRRQRTLDSRHDKSVVSGRGMRRQRGGSIFGGSPSGDSIPAMLERGEYVLNRKAVQAIGPRRLDAINFGAAPRFQVGGFLGDAVGRAVGAARDIVGRGAGFFLRQLPKPNLPQPFTGLGPHIIDNVSDWIRGKAPKAIGAGVDLGSAPASLRAAMALAQKMGLTITSTTGGTHTPTSWHYKGRAFDASNGVNTPEQRAFALEVARRWGSKTLEMFYDPLGWYIKNGSKVSGAIGGHSDHVHVAMQKGGMVRGRVSYFNDGTTASGRSAATSPGVALNLNPGTDSGWNNAKTQGWMKAARSGKPVYARVQIAGKSAVLPIIDLGPAGWVNRAIDVTQPGLEKMGFTSGNFPTDATGVATILGTDPSAGAGRRKGSTKSSRSSGRIGIGKARQLTSAPSKVSRLGAAAKALPGSIRRMLRQPGITAAGRMAAADAAVTLAESTGGILDDRAAYRYRIGLQRRAAKDINKQIGQLNRLLRGPNLSPKKRQRLEGRRDRLLENLGTVKGSILSDRGALKALKPSAMDFLDRDLAMAGLTEGTGDDLAVLQRMETLAQRQLVAAQKTADPRDDTDAANLLQSIREQIKGLRGDADAAERERTQALQSLADELKRQNDISESITSISGREAIRAFGDALSGQIASGVSPSRSSYTPLARF